MPTALPSIPDTRFRNSTITIVAGLLRNMFRNPKKGRYNLIVNPWVNIYVDKS